MEIRVTDRSGNPLADVEVAVSGPSDRAGKTDANGTLAYKGMGAGTYRLRFAHEGFITLEREVTLRGGTPGRVDVALSVAPKPADPPAPPQPAAPERDPMADVAVEPRTVFIPDFIDQNYLGRAPRKDSVLGCAPSSTTTLLQLRDPLGEHSHADTDELLYVVAGEAVLRVGGRDTRIEAGSYSLVPRGTTHSITRRGSNPIVLLSIEAGRPCEGLTAAKVVAPAKEPR
jgi:mannose-6-phosphate isomerase-like protein (cupin superfamily)